jgi:hypothetical protein
MQQFQSQLDCKPVGFTHGGIRLAAANAGNSAIEMNITRRNNAEVSYELRFDTGVGQVSDVPMGINRILVVSQLIPL